MPDEEGLTDEERRALDALPGEAPVPHGFEDRVVAALRERGLVASGSRPEVRPRRQLVRLGLAAGLVGSGFGAGLLASRPEGGASAPDGRSLYLLLLYPGPHHAAGGRVDEEARVAEYGAWARRLRSAGQFVSAERLKDAALVLGGDVPGAAPPGPQGFFLIRARDGAEAEAVARECPHLRHGGRVAVQAVDPT